MFSKRLKQLREEKKISQLDLSRILNISNTALSNYEAGIRIPSDDLKILIANYFNVSLDYLMGRTNIRNTGMPTIQNTPEEEELLNCYRVASNDDKNVIWAVLNKYKKQEKRKKEAT